MIDWQVGARRRAATRPADRALTEPVWRAAFEAVPRHLFVPRIYRDGGATILNGADPATHADWLDAAYSDDSLGTKGAAVPGSHLSWPVRSATQPRPMAPRPEPP